MMSNNLNKPKFGYEEYLREKKLNALKKLVENQGTAQEFEKLKLEIENFQCPLKEIVLKLAELVREGLKNG